MKSALNKVLIQNFLRGYSGLLGKALFGTVAKLAAASGLSPDAARRTGSNPVSPTIYPTIIRCIEVQMKLITKAILTGVILSAGAVVEKLLTPAAALISNKTTVSQLDNSDAAYLAVTYLGNGSVLVNILVTAVASFLIVRVWTRKSKKVDKNEDQ